MKRTYIGILFCVLFAFIAAADEPAEKPSMAFLAMNESASKWVALYVGTHEPDEALLLDRAASDALLKERSIFLQTGEPEKERIDLRKWVSADILLVLETVETDDNPDLVWFRALDVVTGVRLVDEVVAVDLKHPEAGLDAFDRLLREHILPSWQTLWGKGKDFAGVSLMDIRLVDAGVEDRQTFSSLYRMLQQMIVQDPSMILLERNLLEKLVEEEALSPALKLNLQAGMVLLSGSVHQETEGAVFTLRGRTPSNQKVFEETFLLDGSVQPSDLALRAVDLLSQHFKSSDRAVNANLRREATHFHQLARYYYERKDPDRALDAAFTARAMAPTDPGITQSLYTIFYERVMTTTLNLKDPGFSELSDLLDEVLHLFQFLPSIRQHSYDRTSGESLLSTVRSRFGISIESDPGLLTQWKKIEAMYHRSLEKVYDREDSLKSEPTERDRDTLISSLLHSRKSVLLSHFKYLFTRDRRGKPAWPQPVPLDDLVKLMEIMETRPYTSQPLMRKNEPLYNPERDDLYVRNLVLSALCFAAAEHDEVRREKSVFHMRQCALLLLQNPALWTRAKYHILFSSPPAYREQFQSVFTELRREVEEEGWFVPELYFLDDRETQPEVMAKAVDPSLRLLSMVDKPGRTFSKRNELTGRLLVWLGGELDFPDGEAASPAYQDLPREQSGRRRILFHGLPFGEYWVAYAGGGTLEVYGKTSSGIQRIKINTSPRSQVDMRIDKFNSKRFYEVLLGGKRHLYYSHQHSLYQFDKEMNQVRALNLNEWNFPEYMVANLLETSRGVLLLLTKQHLHKAFSENGRLSGESVENNGGLLVLANDRLEPLHILANIERPTPQNALEASGPFDGRSMFEQADGTVLLAALNSKGYSSWFEIGEDRVPRKRNAPEQAELIRAWVESMNLENTRDTDSMIAFCRTRGKSFGLKNDYLPGMRPSISFDFRRVVPFDGGVLVLGTAPGDSVTPGLPGLYYLPGDGKPDEVRKVMNFSGKESFYSLALWEGDVVLTGRNPQYRVIRKEVLSAFLSDGEISPLDQTPFPGPEHLTEQKTMQESFKAEVKPYVAPETYLSHPEALDQLIQVPGGRFPVSPRGKTSSGETWVMFPDLLVSETKVTTEEFFRVYKWAVHNGYRFTYTLEFSPELDKLVDLPTRPMTDFHYIDAILYCNARSEWEGLKPAYYLDQEHQTVLRSGIDDRNKVKPLTQNHVDWNAGYRLLTEAEWERVARGADPTHTARFPWGDTLSHVRANYLASDFYAYDLSSGGVHPAVAGQDPPITRVKAFPPHGFENRFYGLVGNVAEIVWDRREGMEDPGDTESRLSHQAIRYKGGSWATTADECTLRVSLPLVRSRVRNHGFRVVLPGASGKKIEE